MTKQRAFIHVLAGLLSVLVIVATATPSQAIPAFARKYDAACTLCHAAFPKLNDFGSTFRDNGYRLGTDRDNPVNLPGAYFPIAFRTPVGFEYTIQTHQPTLEDPDATIRSGSFQDFGLDVLSVGTLTDSISYHLVFVLADVGTPEAGLSLESAWIRFNDLNKSPWLNVKAGIFEMDVPFSTKRILTLGAGYPIYDHRPAGSMVEMSLSENQTGVELMGHSADDSLRYTLDLVEGDNTALGNKEPFSPDLYGHVTYRLHGQRVGAFSYLGREASAYLHDLSGEPIPGTGRNPKTFYRYGVDFNLTVRSVNFLVMGMAGRDPSAVIDSDTVTADIQPAAQDGKFYGGLVEANWHVSPELVLIARYDVVRNTQQPDPTVSKSDGDIDQVVAAVRKALTINTRNEVFLHAEVSEQRTKQDGGLDLREVRVLLAFDFAL
ncbi:MAG: hypothetical protein ACOYXR_00650 [Nitrospirota bacterium]